MSLIFSSNKYNYPLSNRAIVISRSILLWGFLFSLGGCAFFAPGDAQGDSSSPKEQPKSQEQPKIFAVDVAIARQGSLERDLQYIGTTFPVREVSLRSRVEGQILDLNVDVGDRVEQGQILGRLDDSINQAAVLEAKAELAALQSEVTSLEAEVNEGLTQIKQAKITLKQAQSDLARWNQLVKEGAVTQQSAEQAQNTLDNAQQGLESVQQQILNRNAAVVAAQRRVVAQEALVAQEQQRNSFTVLKSPVTGSVLERVLEPGDLAQVGSEVLQLGDFSQVEVRVQISELELRKIRVGERAQVRLDALPEKIFTGEVTQISLNADATARLIPVEVTIPNHDKRIGRGLLARVDFAQQGGDNIVIPETAVQLSSSKVTEIGGKSAKTAIIFIIQEKGEQATVTAREVQLGDRANSQVEILAGLESGEKFVVRSSNDLQDGDLVNLSFLSESLN